MRCAARSDCSKTRAKVRMSGSRHVRYWHEADIPSALHMSAFGVKRTWPFAPQMSAFDPKRTWASTEPVVSRSLPRYSEKCRDHFGHAHCKKHEDQRRI